MGTAARQAHGLLTFSRGGVGVLMRNTAGPLPHGLGTVSSFSNRSLSVGSPDRHGGKIDCVLGPVPALGGGDSIADPSIEKCWLNGGAISNAGAA